VGNVGVNQREKNSPHKEINVGLSKKGQDWAPGGTCREIKMGRYACWQERGEMQGGGTNEGLRGASRYTLTRKEGGGGVQQVVHHLIILRGQDQEANFGGGTMVEGGRIAQQPP